MSPRASICLSTRNKAEVLDRVLQSIRCQAIPFEYEIVVADDGSTDDTRSICQKHGVVYRYLDNDRYRNPARARNDAYRAARGDVIIAQSDDVVHYTPNTVEALVNGLKPESVLVATVLNVKSGTTEIWPHPFPVYSGPKQPRAFFFLGALWRKDIYAFGGNDEGFEEPCWDDNWFQDCLLQGLKVQLCYAPDVVGHHQSHNFPSQSHELSDLSKDLYRRKAAEAGRTGMYVSYGGPWPEHWRTIPRRMSFFWGGDKLSWMRYMTLASFRCWHPDWEMRLYRIPAANGSRWESWEQEDAAVYKGLDYSECLEELDVAIVPWKCPVQGITVTHASDLCEWDILSTIGGFYSDMDILYIGQIDYADLCQGDALFCQSMGYMTIGFFGAAENSHLFATVRQEAWKGYDPTKYQSTGAEAIYRMTGQGATWGHKPEPGRVAISGLRRMFPYLRFREVPSATVYPWNYQQVSNLFEATEEAPPVSIGIHWFGGNPLAQKWNNILTHENFREYENTFTRYAAESVE